MIRLRSHFSDPAHNRKREWERRRQQFEQTQRETEKRREDVAEEMDSEIMSALVTVVAATQEELARFSVRLDAFEADLEAYDKATVSALMKSNERLAKLYSAREALLDQAFIAEDRRRIFRSEDGSFFVDDTGQQIDPDQFDPGDFNNSMPSAEAFVQMEADIKAEEQRNQAIHDFDDMRKDAHNRIGEIREEIDEGEISQDRLNDLTEELDSLQTDLMTAMPPSIRLELPQFKLDADTPNLTGSFTPQASAASVATPQSNGPEFTQSSVTTVAPQ